MHRINVQSVQQVVVINHQVHNIINVLESTAAFKTRMRRCVYGVMAGQIGQKRVPAPQAAGPMQEQQRLAGAVGAQLDVE